MSSLTVEQRRNEARDLSSMYTGRIKGVDQAGYTQIVPIEIGVGVSRIPTGVIDYVEVNRTIVEGILIQHLSNGVGADALGSPLNCVAWLANTLGEFGISLKAGEIILSGSLVPLEPVVAGDAMTASVEGMGECSVRFV